jgi:hypothetical protein
LALLLDERIAARARVPDGAVAFNLLRIGGASRTDTTCPPAGRGVIYALASFKTT